VLLSLLSREHGRLSVYLLLCALGCLIVHPCIMQCNAEDVFINENARVGDFMREASAVLRILYPPLSNFNATRLWIEGALCGENDDTPMRNFTRGQRQQTTKMVPVLVELEGVGMDMGQPEVDIVRCSCGCVSPPPPPPPSHAVFLYIGASITTADSSQQTAALTCHRNDIAP
jgi:hypothetical protein